MSQRLHSNNGFCQLPNGYYNHYGHPTVSQSLTNSNLGHNMNGYLHSTAAYSLQINSANNHFHGVNLLNLPSLHNNNRQLVTQQAHARLTAISPHFNQQSLLHPVQQNL